MPAPTATSIPGGYMTTTSAPAQGQKPPQGAQPPSPQGPAGPMPQPPAPQQETASRPETAPGPTAAGSTSWPLSNRHPPRTIRLQVAPKDQPRQVAPLAHRIWAATLKLPSPARDFSGPDRIMAHGDGMMAEVTGMAVPQTGTLRSCSASNRCREPKPATSRPRSRSGIALTTRYGSNPPKSSPRAQTAAFLMAKPCSPRLRPRQAALADPCNKAAIFNLEQGRPGGRPRSCGDPPASVSRPRYGHPVRRRVAGFQRVRGRVHATSGIRSCHRYRRRCPRQ